MWKKKKGRLRRKKKKKIGEMDEWKAEDSDKWCPSFFGFGGNKQIQTKDCPFRLSHRIQTKDQDDSN